jgi:predicted methyltransferase
MRRRLALCLLASALVAACGEDPERAEPETPGADAPAAETDRSGESDSAAEGPETGSLSWAVAGDWRGGQAARDEWRHPAETLGFFGVDPSATVVEIWPAAGWYTQILAPWIAANEGEYVAANLPSDGSERMEAFLDDYRERFSEPRYGAVRMVSFEPGGGDIVEPGTADFVLTFRNVHNFMARGVAEEAFAQFYEALRPGGVLGVVEHRLPANREQDPRAASGYVQQDYLVALAEEAGFELEAASEINANPADDADHPFGVWTLPPVRRSSNFGEEPDPEFDSAPYEAIGESDRMTLRFRKPGGEAEDEAAAEGDGEEASGADGDDDSDS